MDYERHLTLDGLKDEPSHHCGCDACRETRAGRCQCGYMLAYVRCILRADGSRSHPSVYMTPCAACDAHAAGSGNKCDVHGLVQDAARSGAAREGSKMDCKAPNCPYCGCALDALDCKCAHPTLALYLAHTSWSDRVEDTLTLPPEAK